MLYEEQAATVRRMRYIAYPAGATIEQRFEKYHEKHPWVFHDMRRLALQARRAGAKRWSVWSIANVLRWQLAVEGDVDDFKINNNYLAFYARRLMESTPELQGFFETRVMKESY